MPSDAVSTTPPSDMLPVADTTPPISSLITAMREMSRAMNGANSLSATAMKVAALEIDGLVRELASLRHVAQSMHEALTEAAATLTEMAPLQHGPGGSRIESSVYHVHATLALARNLNFRGQR